MDVNAGTLDMTSGSDRQTLIDQAQAAACNGMDGTCVVSVEQRRRRALQSTTYISVAREYSYGSSQNAGSAVQDMVNGALGSFGGSVVSSVTTELSARTTVSALGTSGGSAVDDTFMSNAGFTAQLAMRLPGIRAIISTPVLSQPPSPPPPSPPTIPQPQLAPDTGTGNGSASNATEVQDAAAMGTSTVILGIATGAAALVCFLVGFICAARYRVRREKKSIRPNAIEAKGAQTRVSLPEDDAEQARLHIPAKDAADSDFPERPPARQAPRRIGGVVAADQDAVRSTLFAQASASAMSSPGFDTSTPGMPSRAPPVLRSSPSASSCISTGTDATRNLARVSSDVCGSHGMGAVASSQFQRSYGKLPPLGASIEKPSRTAPVIGGANTSAAQNAGKPLARVNWHRANAHVRANIRNGRTMFDDGRFLRSIVEEARAAGLALARPGSAPTASGSRTSSQMLRRRSSLGQAREPHTSELRKGVAGGGGVRLYPPHLDEPFEGGDLDACFVPRNDPGGQ